METQADWMSNLPEEVRQIQINRLAIPGSHNSGAYNLSSELSPDAPGFLKRLCRLPGLGRFKIALRKWCECQRLCIKNQLESGIRYLDLRISSKLGCKDFYLVHSLYGPKVIDALEEVKGFLEAHTGEIVILDFNHFYQMGPDQHQTLIYRIKSLLGPMILSRTALDLLTLNWMRIQQKQVICIYQHEMGADDELMWPRECILSPWPNTKCPDACVKRLTKYMQNASLLSPSLFIVCQGILTPDTQYVMSHWRGGGAGVHRMTQHLRPVFFSWIKVSPTLWPHQPNIVIHDFVDEEDYIRHVLELNSLRASGTTKVTNKVKSERGDACDLPT